MAMRRTTCLRGMYFMHWKFPHMRRAVEAMGDAAPALADLHGGDQLPHPHPHHLQGVKRSVFEEV